MISIITPVYGAEAYIKETLEQTAKQTHQDWEWILVDDCSPDRSAACIESFAKEHPELKIRLIRKEKNEGAAAARNTGIEAAQGRYIAFLDADDIWLPERLAEGLRYLKEKQAGFVFSAYEFGDENAAPTGKIVHVPERLTYREALSRTVIFTTTTLFDTDVIPKDLIKMPLVPSEDTATWWQILRAGYTAYGLDRVLAIYRRPAASLSSNKWKAITRVWNLYRNVERLSLPASAFYFCGWALRATLRRV